MYFLKKTLAIILIVSLLVPGLVVVSEAKGTGLSYCQFSKGPCKHGHQCPLKGMHHKKSGSHENHNGHQANHNDNHDSHKVMSDNSDHVNNHLDHQNKSNQLEICHKDDTKANSIIFTVDRDKPLQVPTPVDNFIEDAQIFSPEDIVIYKDHLSKPLLMPPA